MSHENLGNHYETNFALTKHHNYSLGELEGMYPFERAIYVKMIETWLKDLQERLRRTS
jgi:hypothetical protein